MSLTIVNVGYRSTNFWVVGTGRRRLLVDLGWFGMFGALAAELARKTIPLAEITYGFATHYHLDHAGAAQDLKARGMRLVVTPEQIDAIPKMKAHVKPGQDFTDITLHDNLVVPCDRSRAFLTTIGLDGELVPTPGHSDDSVTLVLDSGQAFTGDLTPPQVATDETAATVLRSWQMLERRGARLIYAGHGPIHAMPNLSELEMRVEMR